MLSLQDFSLVNTWIEKIRKENELEKKSDAFYFLTLGKILDIQDDEIFDSITDNSFLKTQGESGGHDRGIDAIYIEEEDEVPTIHFFNCKHTDNYEKAKNNNFPSNEIDKMISYLQALMFQDKSMIHSSNSTLIEKTEEIWSIFKGGKNPKFEFHICSNYDNGFEISEKQRFETAISRYSNFSVKYHMISYFVTAINGQKREIVNVKFRANIKELFEKTDGDIRALIINIRANELIRMICKDESLRTNLDIEDYSIISTLSITEDVFNDNVRVYKKQKSRINKSIVKTAESEERNRFFYYNNGITITCKSFDYPQMALPVVTLENIQIVNGSQTLHALFEVAKKDATLLSNIELLCRIYELKNTAYSSKIAEYTNSQNPVTTRDIRSIDYIQQTLESEFLAINYYYERKKDQFSDISKKNKIDAEKAGQILMAYYNKMPAEAKNDKRLVFGDKYELIFNDTINCNKVLLTYQLFLQIEEEKRKKKREMNTNKSIFDMYSFLPYSTYHILYVMGVIAEIKKIEQFPINESDIFSYYPVVIAIIEKAIERERKKSKSNYNNASFFKLSRSKSYIDELIKFAGDDFTAEKISNFKKRANK